MSGTMAQSFSNNTRSCIPDVLVENPAYNPWLFPAETPSKWTEANVSEWLRDEGLSRLVGTFAEQHIDGSVLLTLRGDELRDELGITSLGDRKRILAAIDRLQARDSEWGARVVQEMDK